MRVREKLALAPLGVMLAIGPAGAQKGVLPTTIIVGGAPMVSDRDIIENLSRSATHQTFIALVQAAGLADTLRQHGPFTVFAPTDVAFAALPSGQLDSLRRPDNKAALVKLLQTHIVPGDYSTARLRFMMRSNTSNKGQADLGNLDEGKLTVTTNGPSNLALRDAKGTLTDITLYDVRQANGVIYVVDRVMSPD